MIVRTKAVEMVRRGKILNFLKADPSKFVTDWIIEEKESSR